MALVKMTAQSSSSPLKRDSRVSKVSTRVSDDVLNSVTTSSIFFTAPLKAFRATLIRSLSSRASWEGLSVLSSSTRFNTVPELQHESVGLYSTNQENKTIFACLPVSKGPAPLRLLLAVRRRLFVGGAASAESLDIPTAPWMVPRECSLRSTQRCGNKANILETNQLFARDGEARLLRPAAVVMLLPCVASVFKGHHHTLGQDVCVPSVMTFMHLYGSLKSRRR